MKAQVINAFGKASVFERTEMLTPKVIAGHVLIHVKATSVNPVDTKMREGAIAAVAPAFPAVLHGDVAGVVTEVGEGVTEFAVGDEVYGCAGGFKGTQGGALAEYMVADARHLARKPKNITMRQAAALPLVSITAWESLYNRADVQSGQTVLVHGATGGVGHIALQLAKLAGAKVYATGSSKEKLAIGKHLGADDTINYKEKSVEEYVAEHTDGKGFDVVFDTVGGDNLDKSFEAAATYGSVVAIAARSTHDLSPLHAKALSFHVTFMVLKIINEEFRQDYGDILQEVTTLVEEGKIGPLVDEHVFTFNQVSEAHAFLESNKAVGKVVLVNDW